ncbi:MAG: tRNA lysidine(34) synthetase TilS [Elusimicrobiota bacterium]
MENITLKLWNRVKKFIKDNSLFKKDDKILIAVSGGPDSMALLHFFHKAVKNEIFVFHLNHGIRKDAIKDEKIVEDYCKENNIPFFKEQLNIPKLAGKQNLEHIARKKRYELFLKYALKCRANVVVTAHNGDENIETFILNLLRSNKLSALTGIPVKRKLSKKVYVIRPFLCVKKSKIISYLKANHIKYAIDKTNFNTNYTRNWIRHKLLPLLEKKQPNFREHIIEITKQIQQIIKTKKH